MWGSCAAIDLTMDALNKILQGSQHLWRGRHHPQQQHTLSTAYPELDAALPGNGWPKACLSEVLCDLGHGGLSLCLPTLAACSQSQNVALLGPPYLPYAPGLSSAGVDLQQLIYLPCTVEKDLQWAAETICRHGSVSMLILWQKKANSKTQRRLQLAAEQGGCTCISIRPFNDYHQSSYAALRISMQYRQNHSWLRIFKARALDRPRDLKLQLINT